MVQLVDWERTTQSVVGVNAYQAGRRHCEPIALLALHGIDYPVVAASLCILNPNAWPVMDQYPLETVFGGGALSKASRSVSLIR